MLFLYLSDVHGVSYAYPSKDFSSVDITINGGEANEETHTVELLYNYDEKVLEKLQGFIKNFPDDIEYFYVKDLELINFWVNNVENDDDDHLDPYSGELKSYINNSNIEYYVDNRAGGGAPFSTERLGIATFRYDDIIYYVDPYLGTKAEYIIYVPDETKNTKEDLIAAAQKRINEYLGEEGIVTVSCSGTINDMWLREMYPTTRWLWEKDNPNMTFEEFLVNKDKYINSYIYDHQNYWASDYSKFFEVEGLSADDYTFLATIKVGDKEKSFNMLIKKDTSKMITPTYATSDIITDVEINSSSSSIPLDTCIQVEKITSGTEYERIMKILGLKENEMFDLKLYSNSLEKYITKLSNGEFEVKIPISKKFKGKDLIVYYVDKDGKIKEHKVRIEHDFAIFNTEHFSIYTLAEKVNEIYEVTFDANGGQFKDGKSSIYFENWDFGIFLTQEQPTRDGYKFKGWYTAKDGGVPLAAEPDMTNLTTIYAQWEEEDISSDIPPITGVENPQTDDNIITFVIILGIAVIGIAITTKMKKHFK